VRYGLRSPEYDCTTCTEKERAKRNCHNRTGYLETIIQKEDWKWWPESLKHVAKWGDLKFFECPRSAITPETWEALSLVNDTTNVDGDVQHLPFNGAWTDQPTWYRQAVRITKRERAAHRAEQLKTPPKKG